MFEMTHALIKGIRFIEHNLVFVLTFFETIMRHGFSLVRGGFFYLGW